MNYGVDFIDRYSRYFNIGCSKIENGTEYQEIFIFPKEAYEWAKSANINDETKYTINNNANTVYYISKCISNKHESIKISFDSVTVIIPIIKFEKNKYKSYIFQIVVDVYVNEMSTGLATGKYKLLKTYKTRNEAIYFCNKIGYKFSNLYRRYLISDTTDVQPQRSPDVFHNAIIYSNSYMFHIKDLPISNNTAKYTFKVIALELG